MSGPQTGHGTFLQAPDPDSQMAVHGSLWGITFVGNLIQGYVVKGTFGTMDFVENTCVSGLSELDILQHFG